MSAGLIAIGLGAVGAITKTVGGLVGSGKARNAQEVAEIQAAEAQQAAYDQFRKDLIPYIQSGVQANNEIGALLGFDLELNDQYNAERSMLQKKSEGLSAIGKPLNDMAYTMMREKAPDFISDEQIREQTNRFTEVMNAYEGDIGNKRELAEYLTSNGIHGNEKDLSNIQAAAIMQKQGQGLLSEADKAKEAYDNVELQTISGADRQQAAIDQIVNNPMFQSLAKQGEDAMLQSASATGGLRGGNTQAALAQFRPALLNQQIQQRLANLSNMQSIGQNSSVNLGNAGMQNAANQAASARNTGEVRAQAAFAPWQAVSGAIGDATQTAAYLGRRNFGGSSGSPNHVNSQGSPLEINKSRYGTDSGLPPNQDYFYQRNKL